VESWTHRQDHCSSSVTAPAAPPRPLAIAYEASQESLAQSFVSMRVIIDVPPLLSILYLLSGSTFSSRSSLHVHEMRMKITRSAQQG
jgi:hypothetical protein